MKNRLWGLATTILATGLVVLMMAAAGGSPKPPSSPLTDAEWKRYIDRLVTATTTVNEREYPVVGLLAFLSVYHRNTPASEQAPDEQLNGKNWARWSPREREMWTTGFIVGTRTVADWDLTTNLFIVNDLKDFIEKPGPDTDRALAYVSAYLLTARATPQAVFDDPSEWVKNLNEYYRDPKNLTVPIRLALVRLNAPKPR